MSEEKSFSLYGGRREPFAQIYRSFWFDHRISVTAKAVWITIHLHASGTCRAPFPSVRTMAELMHVSRNRINRGVNELVETGFVIKVKRKAKAGDFTSSIYIHFDDPAQATDERIDQILADADNNGSVIEGMSKTDQGWVQNGPTRGFKTDPPVGSKRTHHAARTSNGTTKAEEVTKSPKKVSRSIGSRSNTNTAPSARSAVSPESASRSESDPVGSSEDQEEQTPGEKVKDLSKYLPLWIKKAQGSKAKPLLNASALLAGKEFFEDNPHFQFFDVGYLCVKALWEAGQHSAPKTQTFDPYFYSRRFAAVPNKIFDKNRDNEDIILLIAKELKYQVSAEFGAEEITQELLALFAKFKELHPA